MRAEAERPVEGGEPSTPVLRSASLYPHLRWTIPVHALLPLLIAGLSAASEGAAEPLMAWAWLLIHLAFPLLLLLSYSRWEGRGDELLALLLINHLVTFGIGLALVAWWPF